jgi:preprotein translocase subunit SecE
VARNRKRAKERRARRPQPVSARAREQADQRTGAPNPIEHAAPDAEIAQAAEIPAEIRDAEPLVDPTYEEDLASLREEEEEFEAEREDLEPEDADGELPADGRELVAAEIPAHAPTRRPATGNRLLTFLQGSWRELQRVQWPDRRQVAQATGVVIGFVIVAGVFLGASDWVAGKVVSLIINGHF